MLEDINFKDVDIELDFSLISILWFSVIITVFVLSPQNIIFAVLFDYVSRNGRQKEILSS